MIRVNLIPRAEARRQAARLREQQIAGVIAMVLVLVILIAEFTSRNQLSQVEIATETYREELARLQERHTEAVKLQKRKDQLEAKLKTIELLERQRKGPVRVMEDLGNATPEKLWLLEMRESGGSLSLQGLGLDNQTIAVFMQNLSLSPYFKNVDLVETKQVEQGKAKLKEFSVRARVHYAGGELAKKRAKAAEGDLREAAAEGDLREAKVGAGMRAGVDQVVDATEARQNQQDDIARDLGATVGAAGQAGGSGESGAKMVQGQPEAGQRS